MREALPSKGPYKNESFIINLDDLHGPGSHWCAVQKKSSIVNYYDSFGDLEPPPELIVYLQQKRRRLQQQQQTSPPVKIFYNYEQQQDFDTVWCGHLCLAFLSSSLFQLR